MTDYYVPEPPKHWFFYKNTHEENIYKEERATYLIEKIGHGAKGVEVWYKDCPFPRKGFPFTKAVVSVNILKKMIVEFLKVSARPSLFLGLTLFILSPWRKRNLERALFSFNTIAFRIVSEYILEPQYMSPLTSELQGFIFAFLAHYGIDKNIAKETAQLLATVIEYDNAYRYRIEDVFSETSKEKLQKNPRKELDRILSIYLKREVLSYIQDYAKYFVKIMTLPLLLPSVKKAFRLAVQGAEIERMGLDEEDYFWCMKRADYAFRGKSPEEREKEFKDKGYTMPQGYKIVL